MSDFTNVDVYSSVTLVDRLGLGGKEAEFQFDGISFPFVDEDGQIVTEKIVPQFVAEFLFARGDKHYVWTKPTDTEPTKYVNRYAIKACPKKLIERWGPDVADTSAIARDPDAIEGSDAPLYRTEPVRLQRINLPPNEQPRGNQGRHARMSMR